MLISVEKINSIINWEWKDLGFFMRLFMRTVIWHHWKKHKFIINVDIPVWLILLSYFKLGGRWMVGNPRETVFVRWCEAKQNCKMLHESEGESDGRFQWIRWRLGKGCGKIRSAPYPPYRSCLFLRWYSPIAMIKFLYYSGYPSCSVVLFRGGLNSTRYTLGIADLGSMQYACQEHPTGIWEVWVWILSRAQICFFVPRSGKMKITSFTTNRLFSVQWGASL